MQETLHAHLWLCRSNSNADTAVYHRRSDCSFWNIIAGKDGLESPGGFYCAVSSTAINASLKASRSGFIVQPSGDCVRLRRGCSKMNTERPVRPMMQTASTRRDVRFDGHKTSLFLEDAFWEAFKEIAASRNVGVSNLISKIDIKRSNPNLSSEIRLFVLEHYIALTPRRRRSLNRRHKSKRRGSNHLESAQRKPRHLQGDGAA
jgi:predicted DNA-binding ribbon-helix-helix protein